MIRLRDTNTNRMAWMEEGKTVVALQDVVHLRLERSEHRLHQLVVVCSAWETENWMDDEEGWKAVAAVEQELLAVHLRLPVMNDSLYLDLQRWCIECEYLERRRRWRGLLLRGPHISRSWGSWVSNRVSRCTQNFESACWASLLPLEPWSKASGMEDVVAW